MTTMSRAAAVMTGLALTVAATVGLAPAASAAYSPGPIGPTTWTPDGPVHAAVTAGGRVYVGGGFSGGVAALDASTGNLLWTAATDGDVRALAVSSDGSHVLAGGMFTHVGGAKHNKLASLAVNTGVADPTWKASAGGTVRDIVVNGDTAYFGGTFKKHNGISQVGLGAVTVSTGRADPSFTAATDGNVYSLATNGTRLVIGGKFTHVNGVARNHLASVTLATETLDSWAPAAACSFCNVYWDLTIAGNTVYGANRNAGAATATDLTTGLRRWRVPANGDAQAVTVSDGLVYIGGHFTGIQGQDRTILAALNATTGLVDPAFTPHFVTTYPGIWALASTSSRLYVGGHFTAAGQSPPKRFPYFAIFGN